MICCNVRILADQVFLLRTFSEASIDYKQILPLNLEVTQKLPLEISGDNAIQINLSLLLLLFVVVIVVIIIIIIIISIIIDFNLTDTACMSTEMSFKELFEHLAMYIYDPEQRWKQVVRAKRCLTDCSEVGGCGYDQCYFEGKSV